MIKNFTSRIDHTPLYIGQMSKSNVEVRPISVIMIMHCIICYKYMYVF